LPLFRSSGYHKLQAESGAIDEGLRDRAAETLAAVSKLKGAVHLVPLGSLRDDGKLITDERKYGG
jgi:phenylacetate-CoA ligase